MEAWIMDREPMLRVALALMAGILVEEYVPGIPPLACCAAIVVGYVLMFVATYYLKRKWPFLPCLWITIAAMGYFSAALFNQNLRLQSISMPADYQLLQVKLLETPREGNRCYKSIVQVEGAIADTQWKPVGCKMMLFLPKEKQTRELEAGSILQVAARAQRPDYVDSTTGFDYGRYLRRKGILWQCYVPADCWRQCERLEVNGFFFAQMQQKMVQRLRTCNLPPRQQGIAEALLLGWRGDLDEETQTQFRQSGITHLLCVSGLHVGLMAGIVGLFLFFLGRRFWQRMAKGAIQIASIWFFVLLTGAAPSTVRAGVMFSLVLLGGILNGRSNLLNNLATSAVIMLIIKPMMLFDVGFQLSYAAVLGIGLYYRSLDSLIPIPNGWKWLLPRKVWGWICLSTSAQLGTLPLVLLYFHQFPLYFLVTNLTVVPMAGVLLATAMLVLATGGWGFATSVLQLELSMVDKVTRTVSSWPHAVIKDIYFDPLMAVVLSCALLIFSWLLSTRKYGWRLKKAANDAIM